MGKKNKIKSMTRIPMSPNIANFLNNVREEVNAVYDRYNLPRDLYQKRGLDLYDVNNHKRHYDLFNHSEEMGLPLAYDLYQAGIVSQLVEKSKRYLAGNEAEKLAYCVGSIVEIMASKYGQSHMVAGQGRKGHVDPWTMLLIDVIKYTGRENPEFTSTDVINNIENFYIDHESDYQGLEVSRLEGDNFAYKISNEPDENNNRKPDITRKSLVTRINKLKSWVKSK